MSEISAKTTIAAILEKTETEIRDVYFQDKLNGQEIRFKLRLQDLQAMRSMGLENVPVEAIALPETSPLLHGEPDCHMVCTSVNISRQLTKFFPSRFVAALYELQSIVNHGNFKVSVIGGGSRDLMLAEERKLEVRDVDLTVEGDAIACTRYILEHSKNFTLDKIYESYGTGRLVYKQDVNFDIASTRREIYSACGALPLVVERGVPLAEDCLRRDFTINTLSMSINDLGQILDYTHGLEDIASKAIRILHPVSFFEDPSRILRALKFASRLDFNLSGGTQRLLEKFLEYGSAYYKGGGERIKYELKAFFSLPETAGKKRWMDYFIKQQCFHLVHMEEPYCLPEKFAKKIQKIAGLLPSCWEEVLKIDRTMDIDELSWQVYLCFFFQESSPEMFQRIASRLGLTREERTFIQVFRQLQEKKALNIIHEQATPADIYELFHARPFPSIVALIVDASFEKPGLLNVYFEALMRYKQKLENVHLELDGHDLIELGLPKGAMIGQVLRHLLHIKLSRRLPDRIAEIRYAKQYIQQLIQELPNAPTS